MTASSDPRINALLQHKGSSVPLEPPDIYRDVAEQIGRGTFHDVKLIDPPVQARGSRSGYLNAAYGPRDPFRPYHESVPWPNREPLKPLYTEKLPTSPAFKSLAELAERRRDFWMKVVARGGLAMMVASPVIAWWLGRGVIPAGAFVAGLIIFAATCFVSGTRSRS